MKKFFIAAIFMLCASLSATAQETPKGEAFIGYSYARINGFTPNDGVNANGFSASATYNATKALGLVADFGGYYPTGNRANVDVYTYLFGPRLSYRSDSRFTPYVQALFGGARATGGGASSNAFAFTLGGGLDYKVNDKISVRAIQGEFFRTRFNDNFQNHSRITTGIVFKFGKR